MCCGKKISVSVCSGFTGKIIDVRCGSTSPSGDPYQCPECEERNRNVNWRQQAEENGERYDND